MTTITNTMQFNYNTFTITITNTTIANIFKINCTVAD